MRKGREFELLYEKLYCLDKSKYSVKSPELLKDKITNENREVDVLITYKDSNNNIRKISVECRDRSSIQDVTWIEQLIQKKNDLDIDMTIAVTTSRFTNPAIIKAHAYGIYLETAEKIDDKFVNNLSGIGHCEFHFLYTKAIDIQFQTSTGTILNKKTFLSRIGQSRSYSEELITPCDLKAGIEMYINSYLYEAITIVDEVKKQYKIEDICHNNDYVLNFKVKVDNKILQNKNDRNQVSYLIVKLKIQPHKYSIPLTEGLVVNIPNGDSLDQKFVATYSTEEMAFSHGCINQNFYMPIKFGNRKDKFSRLYKISYSMVTDGVISKNASFLPSFQSEKGNVVENLMGKLDCTELWL